MGQVAMPGSALGLDEELVTRRIALYHLSPAEDAAKGRGCPPWSRLPKRRRGRRRRSGDLFGQLVDYWKVHDKLTYRRELLDALKMTPARVEERWPRFVAAVKFGGTCWGYYFSMGPLGLGYYLDRAAGQGGLASVAAGTDQPPLASLLLQYIL